MAASAASGGGDSKQVQPTTETQVQPTKEAKPAPYKPTISKEDPNKPSNKGKRSYSLMNVGIQKKRSGAYLMIIRRYFLVKSS